MSFNICLFKLFSFFFYLFIFRVTVLKETDLRDYEIRIYSTFNILARPKICVMTRIRRVVSFLLFFSSVSVPLSFFRSLAECLHVMKSGLWDCVICGSNKTVFINKSTKKKIHHSTTRIKSISKVATMINRPGRKLVGCEWIVDYFFSVWITLTNSINFIHKIIYWTRTRFWCYSMSVGLLLKGNQRAT